MPESNTNLSQIINVGGLLAAIGNWLVALIPLVAGVMIAYHYIMKAAAQDEQAAAQHSRSIRTIAISAALGVAALLLVNFILGFVQESEFEAPQNQTQTQNQ